MCSTASFGGWSFRAAVVISCAGYAQRAPDEVAELRRLLAHAAEVDAEAGFSTLSADTAPGTTHLVVRLRPERVARSRAGTDGAGTDRVRADRGGVDGQLAGYLRIQRQADGHGSLGLVVRPELRSRGIATTLFEQLGLTAGVECRAKRDGRDLGLADLGLADPGLSGLRSWARGNHPAAQRLARRFGVPRTARRWQLLIPLRTGRPGLIGQPGLGIGAGALIPVRPARGGADEEAVASVRATVGVPGEADGAPDSTPTGTALIADGGDGAGPHGVVWADPGAGEQTEYGVAGRISAPLVVNGHSGHATRTSLLLAACAMLAGRGVRVGAITVDAADEPLVRDCRLLGFRQDRTDSRYEVG